MADNFLETAGSVEAITTAFEKQIIAVSNTTKMLTKLNAEYKKIPSDLINAQREMEVLTRQQAKADQDLINAKIKAQQLRQQEIKTEKAEATASKQTISNKEKERVAEIKLQQAREKNIDNYNKQQKKELAELNKADNLYNKIKAKVEGLSNTYTHLAAKKELGIKLSIREQAQLGSLEARLKKYNGVLNTINAKVGKSGNYNALNNSITQIARELPNINQGFQGFAITISNNIGAVQDAITNLVDKNKQLAASGEEPISIFEQLTEATFSWQTALSLGFAIFTVYGDEIGDFANSLFSVNKEMQALNESQAQFNQAQIEGRKDAQGEIIEFRKYLAVVKDVKVVPELRKIALQNLRSEYPYYFKNLTDEQILLGQTEEAQLNVIKALEKRKEVEKKSNINVEYNRQIIDLEKKQAVQLKEKAKAERSLEKNRDLYAKKHKENIYFVEVERGIITKANIEHNKIEREKARLQGVIIKNDEDIIKLKKETIALEFNPEDKKEKELQVLELEDVQAKIYELKKLQLENEAEANEKIFSNEEVNYSKREEAAKRYNAILKELADIRLSEELRVLQKELDARVESIKEQVKKGEVSKRNGDAVEKSLQSKHWYDTRIAYENHAKDMSKVDESIKNSMKGIYDKINFQKAENLISERELRNTEEYARKLSDIVKEGKDYRDIEKATKEFQANKRKDAISDAALGFEIIEKELSRLEDIEANVQKRVELEGQLLEAKKAQADLQSEDPKEQAEALKKLQEATESYIATFRDGFLGEAGFESLNPFLKLEENGKTAFENLMAGADEAKEKFAVAFNAITSIAEDTFNFLQQNSAASFQAQYDDLDRRKEIALQYADQTEEGRQRIEEQYEERRKQIRQQEAKAQKSQALFSIALNTAQGITAALASVPPNIPLSIAIGLIGAAQAAMVASKSVPAYFKGTDNHPGGFMMVNDATGSNFREVIETPDGKVMKPQGRNVLMNAPKGTKVYKNYREFDKTLNDMIASNGIAPYASMVLRNDLPPFNTPQGLTKQDLEGAFDKSVKKLSQQKTFVLNIDKSGFDMYLQGKDARRNLMEDRVNANIKSL